MRHVTSGSIHPRQRGTVSLMAALLIAAIGVAALVSLDVGFVFYTQRQLQKLVDVAALSGAQQLKSADDQATTNANVLSAISVTDGKVFFSINVDAAEARAWESVRAYPSHTMPSLTLATRTTSKSIRTLSRNAFPATTAREARCIPKW